MNILLLAALAASAAIPARAGDLAYDCNVFLQELSPVRKVPGTITGFSATVAHPASGEAWVHGERTVQAFRIGEQDVEVWMSLGNVPTGTAVNEFLNVTLKSGERQSSASVDQRAFGSFLRLGGNLGLTLNCEAARTL